ncbi:phosphotransferase enzyme family domain protein [Aspergillus ambiguus]|uniref:phosphotransferase family protein n=1 Tax=Aspergillus ambiguus TaxID=176160 RepID=UPI003CCE3666
MAGQVLQPLDIPSLEKYLQSAVPEIQTPVYVEQQLTAADGKRYVLRKKPPGQLFSRNSHQIERKYAIFQALKQSEVPVPKTYCICLDNTVLGTPFFIMEHLNGRIFYDSTMPGVSVSERSKMWKAAVKMLACIHRLDPNKAVLQYFGKPGRYYDRQIALLQSLSASYVNVRNIKTKKYVGELAQRDDQTVIIHGDFKIDNLVFHKSKPQIIGVLDWEMATLGHPLADICNLTHPYFWNGLGQNVHLFQTEQVQVLGLPTRKDCVRWYTEVSGWDPTPYLPWGDVFFMFRTTIIVQSITARYARRQASEAQAKYIQQVKEMKQRRAKLYRL